MTTMIWRKSLGVIGSTAAAVALVGGTAALAQPFDPCHVTPPPQDCLESPALTPTTTPLSEAVITTTVSGTPSVMTITGTPTVSETVVTTAVNGTPTTTTVRETLIFTTIDGTPTAVTVSGTPTTTANPVPAPAQPPNGRGNSPIS